MHISAIIITIRNTNNQFTIKAGNVARFYVKTITILLYLYRLFFSKVLVQLISKYCAI